ncbi:MAG: Kelch repeat-containing protein [Planctomycetota bacterium]|jgi:N-acetylneuraminic acid mutarotase
MSRKKTFRALASLVFIEFAIALPSMSLAQVGKWTTKADMPTARYGLSTSTVNGKIYAIGGRAGGGRTARVEEYDPATDTWTRKADMPTARNTLSTGVVDGKIYAIGGSAGGATAEVEEYDPATDTWRRRADLPTARRVLSASAVNGKIYAIGGGAGIQYLSTVEEYDPATDTWTRKASMPAARAGLATSMVDGRIYAIGGFDYWDSTTGTNCLSTVEEYDPATDTWATKADMPTARYGLSTSVVGGIVYAIGGLSQDDSYLSTVEAYDPATDTWVPMGDTMPTGRYSLGTSVVDNSIYAIGGLAGPLPPGISTVEEYDPFPHIVDFNADRILDINDLVILIEYWGTDELLCDIAPPPDGDGIVDVLDLELFMSYWQ